MNQDRSTKIYFAVVFIGCPAFYFLWRLMPYLIFYAAPFLILSCTFAALWAIPVNVFAEEDYSWLGLIIPLSAVALFLKFGFPKGYLATKADSVPIEGVYFFNLFNAVKGWFDHALWSVIPEGLHFLAPTVPVSKEPYGLNSVRWILWVSLEIGAPMAFLAFCGHQGRAFKNGLEAKYQKIAKDNQDELDTVRTEKFEALRNAEIDKRHVEEERDHHRTEHAKLKTLMEFQKKAAGSINENGHRESKKGVLDSEDL